jgi:Zn-dependent protease with chaperone function
MFHDDTYVRIGWGITVFAFAATALLVILKKFGVLAWYDARFGHIRWLPPAGCYFCLSFWLYVVAFTIYQALEWRVMPELYLYALCQAPLSAFFTQNITANDLR